MQDRLMWAKGVVLQIFDLMEIILEPDKKIENSSVNINDVSHCLTHVPDIFHCILEWRKGKKREMILNCKYHLAI